MQRESMEVDVVIVGAGPAGLYVCAGFSRVGSDLGVCARKGF